MRIPDVTVYTARRILTMDPGRPVARAIAVKDGRLLSIGDLDTMRPWLERFSYEVDETFQDHMLMPGFIDPLTHFRMSEELMSTDLSVS